MSMANALATASVEEDTRHKLWLACRAVPGLDAERWRYDHAGLLMKWDEFDSNTSKVGWHLAYNLAYIVAPADGGADHNDNLQAVSFAALHGGEGTG